MGNAFGYCRCGLLLPAFAFLRSAILYAPHAAAVEDSPVAAMPPATPAAMAKCRQELEAYSFSKVACAKQALKPQH
jgi:hypothetical protein